MKSILFFIITLFSTQLMAGVTGLLPDPTQIILPESFVVYVNGTTVLDHPEVNFTEKALPTTNLYKGIPGCYIACYSQQEQNAVYPVGNRIYLMGQVRIAGKYAGRHCEPTNFAGKDISANDIFKTICNEKIKACEGAHCWAGGDTGGWFGIQETPTDFAPATP